MNVLTPDRKWLDTIIAHHASDTERSTLPWLNTTRERARQLLGELAIPTRKHEAWRYTSLDTIVNNTYRPQVVPVTGLDVDDIDSWVYSEKDSYRLVFANGHSVPTLSNIQSMPDNIKLGSLRAMMATDPELVSRWLVNATGGDSENIFKTLNKAFINDGLFLYVPPNVTVDKPIEVVYLNLGLEQATLCQPRSLVILGDNARATLVERYSSTGKSEYLFNGVNDVQLGAHASLQHYRLQQESKSAVHLSHVDISQDRDSVYQAINIATGAAWSRNEIAARFTGEHAVCDINGLYTVTDKQYMDFHLDIRHNLPNCQSRENFRGIVFGAGRAVFDGKILVEKGAQKTDAHLSNKNLLLTENAEIDTKPQLEIYADDVKCSHGTTVGKIDPNQLFYLRSRGIEKHAAYNMLCLGFAEQILEQVTDQQVYTYIQNQLSELTNRQDVDI
jgi:Fe-S cluster assembly protein SufD